VREYEIGSEAWFRERSEHGLDPSERDAPQAGWPLRLDSEAVSPAGRQAEAPSPWSAANAPSSFVY
jgi:hypothetical protein